MLEADDAGIVWQISEELAKTMAVVILKGWKGLVGLTVSVNETETMCM